ncbi:gamma-glutamyltransferase [Parasediminibacterium sp. JCM 36343]|uniref:gamma-glutamyltransferase n=1 Tax=Parasediminibacterium sp. JCM 36343 TaxID=3374279 RepID=UPI00397D01A6
MKKSLLCLGAIGLQLLTAQLVNAQSKTAIVGAGKAVDPYNYAIVKTAEFKNGSVSCAHPLASMVGASIMKQGGNAFDAAIAVQFALAVVYPAAGNIGGGGFLVARTKEGKNISIDFRETAPGKATKDMYLDKDGNAITKLSKLGALANGVPGTVAGAFEILKYAKLPISTLIQPAIDIAEFGFVISEKEAKGLNGTKESFVKNSTMPSAYVKETIWKTGDTLVNKDLAETLKRIRDNGQKGFYEGKTAQLIVDEMNRGNGIISLQDLKDYKAKSRTALQFDYKGYTIIGMPPPSSGGIIIWQMMKMIENRNIAQYGFQSPKAVQLMIEVERRAYADRAEHLGDPDFWKVPMKTLSDNTYLAKRMEDYDSTKATPSKDIKAGTIHESNETTHISIFDKEGNMVSVTTTLNGGYGNRTVIGGAGFIMNNEMDDFSVKPGTPNMFGALGGTANAIEPHKRMLSSMSPTLVLKNNKPYIVAGTPGGTTIPTSVFQTLVNMLEFNMNAEDAVNKPKFHHQWMPDQVDFEPTFNKDTKTALEAMGYKMTPRAQLGRTEVIRILPDGKKETAADKRGDDSVAGY